MPAQALVATRTAFDLRCQNHGRRRVAQAFCSDEHLGHRCARSCRLDPDGRSVYGVGRSNTRDISS